MKRKIIDDSSHEKEQRKFEIVNPAKAYPFSLDTFQREAIFHIENNESVLVAAHTSAGKTAVAEYAIAKSLKNKQRVIYTSPIKALSNQKFRDLQEEFEDVGLMTGDMTINPNASCIIMTTEILRSMLYRGSEIIREVAWVIYDEVHYMRDKERGVVWEESIILLPHKVRFVFLSATIPNAKEFVSWVSKIHRQPCHVVYTEYRPVPLQHFLFPIGSEGLFLVVDEKGSFRDDNFQKAMGILQPTTSSDSSGIKRGKQKSEATKNLSVDLFKIVRLIMDRELDPCIVFSFSKKDCETFALQMARLDFNSQDEKNLVEHVFSNALEALSDEDQSLPQVKTLLPLLKRGIGIHHGGLLPILKEIIEILFQEGLIKCLFATETFSIGINMPAKTVVFTSTRKFDGKDFRWVTSGEYIQMSGRAGRRGKDDKGIVIQIIDEKMEPDTAKDMIYGASDPLFSSYHVSYNMLLNMMRVEGADPENILKASFHQFQQEKESPLLLLQAEEIQREANTLVTSTEDSDKISEFVSLTKLLYLTKKEIRSVVIKPEYTMPFLQPGRIVSFLVESGELYKDMFNVNTWGVIISCKFNEIRTSFTIDVLSGTNFDIQAVESKFVVEISAIRLNIPKDLNNVLSREKVIISLNEVLKRYPNSSLPLLDPISDMGIDESLLGEKIHRILNLNNKILSMQQFTGNKTNQIDAHVLQLQLLEKAADLRDKVNATQSIVMKETMRKMRRVLRRLQYVSDEGTLGLKGRFACELTTGDELVLTDLIFDGAFNDLTAAQVVAVLSMFVYKEGDNDEKIKVRNELVPFVQKLYATARNICRVFNDVNIVTEEEEFVKSFNKGLIEVCHLWASGGKFVDCCSLTDTFEGSIIRTIRRLEELLRQLASASVAIGNNELHKKFEEGAEKIRRGVVFAASLYV